MDVRSRLFAATVLATVAVLALVPLSEASNPPAKNGKIAFDRDVGTPSDEDLFAMNANGSGQTNLTHTPEPVSENDPAYSPNGRLIAFSRCGDADCDIAVIRSNGSGFVNLTNTPLNRESNPEFAPDGRTIVFAQSTGTNRNIWL